MKINAAATRPPETGLAPSLEGKRLRIYLFLMIADIGAILGSCALAYYFYGLFAQPGGSALLGAQLILPIFLTVALHNGTYSMAALIDWRSSSLKMALAVLVAAALLHLLAFLLKLNEEFSRIILVSGLMTATVWMAVVRFLTIRWVRNRWGPIPLNRLVIDAGGPPMTIPHAYHVDAADHALTPSIEDPHALDRLSRYLRNMDEVIVNCPLDQRGDWAKVLKSSGVHGEVSSEVVNELGVLSVIRRDDAQISTLLVSTGPLGMRARAAKRVLDLVVSISALLLISPVLLAAALAIKLEDGGPVLFRQRRLGRNNRFFSIYKLRTMKVETTDADGTRSTERADNRITRVGRVLRRTSLDELPQLLNVVRGDMSIVGPRPHAIGSLAGDKTFWEVDSRYWQRHSLRPGITGLAQIRGFRGATELESDLSSRLQADLEYLSGWNIWRDISIMLSTMRVVVHDRAY